MAIQTPVTLAYHISFASSDVRLFILTSYVGGTMSSGLCISVCLLIGKYGCLLVLLYSSCALRIWFVSFVIASFPCAQKSYCSLFKILIRHHLILHLVSLLCMVMCFSSSG